MLHSAFEQMRFSMFWGHLSIGVLSADCRAGVQERGKGWTLLLLAERPGQDESTYHMHEEGAEGPGSDRSCASFLAR